MSKYSNRNFQNETFENQDLSNADFSGSDLRGADFTGADLTGAILTNVITGIAPLNKWIIFFLALAVSLLSGYIAMHAGTTIHEMLDSTDVKVRVAGIASIVISLLFLCYYYWKGGLAVIKHILIPVMVLSAILWTIGYISELGSGEGIMYLTVSLLLVVLMVTIGTVSRALAGVLSSSVIFLIVAAGGSLFGKSLGGGIGTVIMAIACALISKRALSGAKGFEILRKITSHITCNFGTSFRNSKLNGADFSNSQINNADFTDADLSSVNWGNSKKINCTSL